MLKPHAHIDNPPSVVIEVCQLVFFEMMDPATDTRPLRIPGESNCMSIIGLHGSEEISGASELEFRRAPNC